MVNAVRKAEEMIGRVDYEITEKKMKSRQFSRSLYITSDVKKGDIVNEGNVRSIRPGYGLHPKYLSLIIGKRYVQDFKMGTALSFDKFE